MKLPTESQWARYSALCARLQSLPTAERAAVLQALRATQDEDPQVLSLVALHWDLPPDPHRLRTGERVGNCILEELLGAGGMGVVYRAQQHLGPAQRRVAVKLIHPALLQTAGQEAVTRFLAELHILATLQHASITRIYDGGLYEDPYTHEPLPYLVMELIHGGLPLTTYARDYALPWRERLALVLRVCRAVEYAHEYRVVHRDLKPANILVDPEGHPMVIDFGLASTADALLPGAHLVAAGTPAYMSPEQVSDAFGPISAKSDVYALGLLVYELLTEQLPYVFPRDNAVEALCRVITEAVPLPLSQYDPVYGGDLDALMAATLAKRPTERPSVAVLRARLERTLQTHAPANAQPGQDTWQPQRGDTPGGRPPDAERRQLTILFCDLVESTALATQLDPEDLRAVIRAYHEACAEVIQHFGGYIAQYLGDGLLVYFGYPQAHEDDARRAVRTGIGLVAVMGPLNTRLEPAHGIRLAVRVGIHTGLVVIGTLGDRARQEPLALGETPNTASRLQGLAAPDTVVISAATAHLVAGYFVCQPLGAQALQGIATPVQVSQVLHASGAQNRLDIVPPHGLSPLVGRDEEVALVQRRWAQAKTGMGQVVLISGEAGIGKSRLVQVLKDHVATEPHARIEWRGSPHHQPSALYPIVDHLHRLLRWHPDDPPTEKLHRLEATLTASGMELSEAVPLVAALLSLPLPPSYPPLTLTPQRQRQHTFDTLLAWLHAEAQRWPVLVIVEDLHWVDPSTLELLSLLIDQSAQTQLCLALTARPEFHPPWTMMAHLTSLTLRRLTPAQIEHLATHVAGDKALPPAVLQEVIRKTDGVPLFVEELLKTVLESGLLRTQADHYELSGPLPPLAIPATLHDALMARLDRLASVKVVAQLGAAIGRTFPYVLMQAVAQMDTATLHGALAQLVETEVVAQRGLPPQATYTFKHALIQDAAYQSLLRSTRQQYHQQIAQVLEVQFADICATQPELVAHHYTEAGLSTKAIPYWQRAGHRALARSGYREAVACFEQALSVLRRLPERPETLEQAIDLCFDLRNACLPQGDRERILDHLREAETLAQVLDDRQRLGQVAVYMTEYFRMISDLDRAVASGQRARSLATSLGDVGLQVKAHHYVGTVYYEQGDYHRAIDCLKWSVATLQGDLIRERFGMTGLPSVLSRVYLSWSLVELGAFAEGAARGEEGVQIAEATDHPFSLIWAYSGIGHLYFNKGDVHRGIPMLKRGLELCQTWDIPALFPRVARALGNAYALSGQVLEALPLLEQAASQGRGGGHALYFVHLSTAYLLAGRIEEALERVQHALSLAQDRKQRGYQAYALCLLGDIAVRREPPASDQAEAHYRQALSLAEELGMLPLQAHCHRGLGTLYASTGQREQARTALSTAIEMYQSMEMTFWLPQTEVALAQIDG